MLLEERVVDEFAFILIGALILFFGLAYFVISSIDTTAKAGNITGFIEALSISNLKFDTINRTITIIETQGSVYKSLFSEKQDIIPLKLSSEELLNVEKIKIYFESKNNISEIFLSYDKNLIPISREIPKEFLSDKSYIVVKLTELDYTFYIILSTIYIIVILILYYFYKKYQFYNLEIKILILSVSLIFFSILLIFGTKKIVDEYFLRVDIILKSFLQKTYYFQFREEKRNVTIYFELERAIQTSPIRIVLNDAIFYEGRPYVNRINITKEVFLKKINNLKIELEGEAYYEIKNFKVLIGPARS